MGEHYWKVEQKSGVISAKTTYYHWDDVHPKTLDPSRFADPGEAHKAVGELYSKYPFENGWEFRVVKLKRGESEPITFLAHGTGKEHRDTPDRPPVSDRLIAPAAAIETSQ